MVKLLAQKVYSIDSTATCDCKEAKNRYELLKEVIEGSEEKRQESQSSSSSSFLPNVQKEM